MATKEYQKITQFNPEYINHIPTNRFMILAGKGVYGNGIYGYYFGLYFDQNKIPMFYFGCEHRPIKDWNTKLINKLCKKHGERSKGIRAEIKTLLNLCQGTLNNWKANNNFRIVLN
jgi:hypothetical protein